MNFLKISIIITVLLNAVYPCADIHHQEDGSPTVTIASSEDSSGEKNIQDHCSPLCICECCAVAPTVNLESNSDSTFIELPNKFLTNNGKPISAISLVFQPPKYFN